jgi:hypothetical protein
MSEALSLDACAKRLGTSRNFIDTMVSKGRLHPDAQGCVTLAELEQLASLLTKLRDGGIAAMVETAEQQ